MQELRLLIKDCFVVPPRNDGFLKDKELAGYTSLRAEERGCVKERSNLFSRYYKIIMLAE